MFAAADFRSNTIPMNFRKNEVLFRWALPTSSPPGENDWRRDCSPLAWKNHRLLQWQPDVLPLLSVYYASIRPDAKHVIVLRLLGKGVIYWQETGGPHPDHEQKIVLDSNNATNLKASLIGALPTYSAKARKEVILSAGSLQSPELLMVSGVHPRATLEKFKIPVVFALEGGDKICRTTSCSALDTKSYSRQNRSSLSLLLD
jgi:hypothetical protein